MVSKFPRASRFGQFLRAYSASKLLRTFAADRSLACPTTCQVDTYYETKVGRLKLREIEKLDADKNESPEKRYFWFLYDNQKQKLNHLDFISMDYDKDYQYRKLENINLQFNLEKAEVKTLTSRYPFIKSILCLLTVA